MSQNSDDEVPGGAAVDPDGEFEVSPADDVRVGGRTARAWVFTAHSQCLNNPDENARRQAWVPPVAGGRLRYIVCQREVGGNTGREHWQGYVQLDSPQRAAAVRRILGCDWAWIKPARGTPAQARAYCTKEDTRREGDVPHESGTMVDQGKRVDLDAVAEMSRSGATLAAIADAHPGTFMRYHAGISKFHQLVAGAARSTMRREALEVIVVCGPPGTGKSRFAWDTYPDLYNLSVGSSATVWWDGYDAQETVLIDDFQGGIAFRTLLNYLDIYAIQVPVKGGMVWLAAKRIIITSNLFYADWYAQDPNGRRDMAALQRRITELRYMPAIGAEPQVWRRGRPEVPTEWVPLQCPFVVPMHAPGFHAPS